MQKLEGDNILKVKDLPIDVESKARIDVPDEPMETEDDNEDYEMEEEDDEGSLYETETETTESEMESDVEKRTG